MNNLEEKEYSGLADGPRLVLPAPVDLVPEGNEDGVGHRESYRDFDIERGIVEGWINLVGCFEGEAIGGGLR